MSTYQVRAEPSWTEFLFKVFLLVIIQTSKYECTTPPTKKVQWHTSVKFLEHVPGGELLQNSQAAPTSMLPSYDDSNEDDDDQDSGPNLDKPSPSHGATQVNNLVDQNQTPGSSGNIEPSISEDVNQSVGDRQVTSNTDNSENVDDLGEDTHSHQDTDNTTSTSSTIAQSSKRKGKISTVANDPPRRSTRTTKPYNPYQFDNKIGQQASEKAHLPDRKPEPSSYNEAMTCKDNCLWRIAVEEQLQALIANGTWELVKRPSSKDVNVITSKWVFKVKYTSSGLIDRHKARLVARGFTQVYGIDYEETFAPTLRMESLRILLAFAAYFGFEIEQMDVPDAYLKGDLTEEIYMEIPQGYQVPSNQRDGVLRLLRPLYGLKQSGREWNIKVKRHLKSIGFTPITSDNCVFINKTTHVIIALYVDDLLIFAKNMAPINKVKSELFKEYKIKDGGKASFILGMRIRREGKRLVLDQSTYIRNFLREFGMENSHSVATPIDGYHALTPSEPSEPRTDAFEYQQRVGKVMYAMTGTRVDLAQSMGKLSQYCQDPAVRHRTAMDRLLRYLNGTVDLTLVFDFTDPGGYPVCYADASYGDDKIDRKSTYGHTLLIGNASVTWTSKKQRTIATSTTEVEYVAMCQASKNILWATRRINELGFDRVSRLPIQLFGDNQGTLDLIKNPEHHSRTKHIDVQYHYIREAVAYGHVKTVYIPSRDMIADILTKPTKPEVFTRLRAMLGLKVVDF